MNPCVRDIIVLEVKAFGIHSLYPDVRVFDSHMVRSVPLSLTIGTSKQSSITVFNLLINFYTVQILFYPSVYQFKVGVCMCVCVWGGGGIGVGGGFEKFEWNGGGGLESFVFKGGGAQNFFKIKRNPSTHTPGHK